MFASFRFLSGTLRKLTTYGQAKRPYAAIKTAIKVFTVKMTRFEFNEFPLSIQRAISSPQMKKIHSECCCAYRLHLSDE